MGGGSEAAAAKTRTAASHAAPALLSEIRRVIDIGDKSGLFRLPAELRAGATAEVEPLVYERCRLTFEYSAFAVDGRPDLSVVVYDPTTAADADKINSMIGSESALERT